MEMTPISGRPRASSSPITYMVSNKSENRSQSAPLFDFPLEIETKVYIVCNREKSSSNGFTYKVQYNNNSINSEKFTAIVGREIQIYTDNVNLYLDDSGKYALKTTKKVSNFIITRNMSIICDENGKIILGTTFSPITYYWY